MFQTLYKKCLDLAAHKSSNFYLGLVSFIESSFFPIPPDVMIIPMVIAKKIEYDPEYRSWRNGYHINIQSVAERYFKTGSFKGKVEDLYNDKSVHKQAFKEQISDRMTDVTFWDNISNQ